MNKLKPYLILFLGSIISAILETQFGFKEPILYYILGGIVGILFIETSNITQKDKKIDIVANYDTGEFKVIINGNDMYITKEAFERFIEEYK